MSIYWHTQQADDLPRELSWLSEWEKSHYAGFRFPKRQQGWLLGRWTAKNLLNQYHPICQKTQLSEITIKNQPSGAPIALVNDIELAGCISISHREGFACAAWTDDPLLKVGVDLEVVEPKARAFVEDYFTAEEVKTIDSLPINQRDLSICLLWSAKEAVLKALQQGLRLDTRSIEINLQSLTVSEDWQTLAISHLPIQQHISLQWRMVNDLLLTLSVSGESINNKLIQG